MKFTSDHFVEGLTSAAPNPPRRPWLRPLLLLCVVATLIISPMPFLGNASGHDFQFHVASWMEAASQWHQNIFYPRWAAGANYGFGEPRFIFYPPASWFLGAALGLILPWVIVPGAYVWLVLVGAGMAMWRFASEWLAPREAIAAAVFFAINPYNIVLVYYRSDFAELLTCALFPLLLLGLFRIVREGAHGLPLTAVVFAGIWLSNAPAGVIATYSLALLLVVSAICTRSLRPVLAGGGAMILGFGLTAFYILPAAFEQRWVQISQVVSENLAPDRNFLFTHSEDPEFLLFNLKISGVALLVIVITAIAAVFVARRRRSFPGLWWLLLALGAASMILMFPISEPLWRHLPKLQFLQFPWRWLGPLGAVFASFVGALSPLKRKQNLAWAAILFLLALYTVGIASDTWWDNEDIGHVADGVQSGYGYQGTDEYAPLGSNIYVLPGWIPEDTEPPDTPPPAVEMLDSETNEPVPLKNVTVKVMIWAAERKQFTVRSDSPVTLAIRLLNYPAWHATVDGKPALIESLPATAEMLLSISAGTHVVEIRFVRTFDRKMGTAISGVALAGLFVLIYVRRRRP
jgi:hypothetical protein